LLVFWVFTADDVHVFLLPLDRLASIAELLDRTADLQMISANGHAVRLIAGAVPSFRVSGFAIASTLKTRRLMLRASLRLTAVLASIEL
jgi:hypothetical protein